MPEAKVPTKSNFESLESYKKRKNGCIGKQSLLGMIYEKAYLVQPATQQQNKFLVRRVRYNNNCLFCWLPSNFCKNIFAMKVVEKRNYFKMVQYYYVFDLLLPILEMGRKSAKNGQKLPFVLLIVFIAIIFRFSRCNMYVLKVLNYFFTFITSNGITFSRAAFTMKLFSFC